MFPIVKSILSAAHLAPFLQGQYDLSGEVNFKLIKNWVNDTYLLESGAERFIFRVYSYAWRLQEEIVAEVKLL